MKYIHPDLNIVVVGGGSGSFAALKAARQMSSKVTAIVTMFDSGGSSGILRDEFNILPPGDARRCLAALASGPHEELFRKLLNFRFQKESSLNGHNFGNLLLLALSEITGSMQEAIVLASNLLTIEGRVFPVSRDNATLCAELEDGQKVVGEKNIDHPNHDGNLRISKMYLSPEATLLPEAEAALLEADIIIMGPGDLYTSIIPNLLVKGFSHAVRHSKAKKICVVNLMTKWGETNGYTASMFAKELLSYSGLKKFDYVICNRKIPPARLLDQYARARQYPFAVDLPQLSKVGEEIVLADLVHENDFVRHDARALAQVLRRVFIQKAYITYMPAVFR